jgi:hypothetical protein
MNKQSKRRLLLAEALPAFAIELDQLASPRPSLTMLWARTMALDSKTKNICLPTPDVEFIPSADRPERR